MYYNTSSMGDLGRFMEVVAFGGGLEGRISIYKYESHPKETVTLNAEAGITMCGVMLLQGESKTSFHISFLFL